MLSRMLPWGSAKSARRRSGPLPSSRRNSSQDYRHDFGTYKPDKGPPILRILVGITAAVLLVFWFRWGGGDRERALGGRHVVSRDWRGYELTSNYAKVKKSSKIEAPTVMIMCTMKDAIEHIWHFFYLIDQLDYPRSKLHVAILVSDTTDQTYERALELADERQYKRSSKERYGRISVFRKDFAMEPARSTGAMSGNLPASAKVPVVAEDHDNAAPEVIVGAGKARHNFEVQIQRRKLLGVSRTWLLNSALTPEVDYALWIDVDVVDYEPRLIQTLLEWGDKEKADVVIPNCVWKTYNELGSYDRNNWQETPESMALKEALKEDEVLIEGYELHLKTNRRNMADMVPADDTTPEMITLDGVGGCTALINAGLHRRGAVFPAWPVDHQLETEGFAQLAKRLGGKMIGLPKYYVYHGLYG